MKRRSLLSLLLVCSLFVTACGTGVTEETTDLIDKQLNQITAAKSRFAIAKTSTPVLNTHDWDSIFGGASGSELKYDRFGEIDELVFVALKGTLFTIQRQIRKENRSGKQTIYYKVTTPDYQGSETLWVDGRFLDLRDVQPKDERESMTAAKTLIALRRNVGAPYTWHGASDTGMTEILDYYPPSEGISERTKDDWKLRGFDSPGLLYHASNGATPIDMSTLARFGEALFIDLSKITAEEGNDDPNAVRVLQAKKLLTRIKPLDVIIMGDRMWTVLDRSEVIESRYESKFAGKVQVSPLFDTLFGLLQKGSYVKNPFEELEDLTAKKFYIRRFVDTSSLVSDQLDGEEEEELSETSETEEESSEDPSNEDAEILNEDTEV